MLITSEQIKEFSDELNKMLEIELQNKDIKKQRKKNDEDYLQEWKNSKSTRNNGRNNYSKIDRDTALIQMLENLKENTGFTTKNVGADSDYGNEKYMNI